MDARSIICKCMFFFSDCFLSLFFNLICNLFRKPPYPYLHRWQRQSGNSSTGNAMNLGFERSSNTQLESLFESTNSTGILSEMNTNYYYHYKDALDKFAEFPYTVVAFHIIIKNCRKLPQPVKVPHT